MNNIFYRFGFKSHNNINFLCLFNPPVIPKCMLPTIVFMYYTVLLIIFKGDYKAENKTLSCLFAKKTINQSKRKDKKKFAHTYMCRAPTSPVYER